MEVGKAYAGKTFVDLLGKHPAKVTIGEEGKGEFHVSGRSVSVWISEADN